MSDHITVYLYKRERPDRGTPEKWYLKWANPATGKYLSEAIEDGECSAMTKRDADKIRQKKELDLNTGKAAITRPEKMTLAQFIEAYPERRRQGTTGKGYLKGSPRLDEATIKIHLMALRYMQQHFGQSRALATITVGDAEAFVEAMAANKLESVRKPIQRVYDEISDNSTRKMIRTIKAVYSWAKRFGYANENPFADFDGRSMPGEPKPYVPVEDIDKVLGVATGGWKVLFALCRHAGLRLEEARTLPWNGQATDKRGQKRRVGVDWDAHKLHIVSPKTKMYRVVPISPKLYDILLAEFEAAPERATLACGLSRNNLHRNGQKLVESAGLTAWVYLFQSLRTSWENDLKVAGIPEPTYATWLGHGVKVSRDHYTAPTEPEFTAIIGKIEKNQTSKAA